MVNDVPITVLPPISKIVLVPIGHFAISTLPLMLSILASIKAPTRGAKGMHFFRAKPQKYFPQLDKKLDVCLT